jgi:uncharacterized protein (TIGR02391 family)
MSKAENVLLVAGIAALIGFLIFQENKKANKKEIEKKLKQTEVPKGPYHDFLEEIKVLFQNGHHTQAVLETSKLLYKAIQDKSGISDVDGTKLIDRAFGKNGDLRFNVHSEHENLDTHEGFYFLCKGASLAFRNPVAHAQIKLNPPEAALQIYMMGYLIDHVDKKTIAIPQQGSVA